LSSYFPQTPFKAISDRLNQCIENETSIAYTECLQIQGQETWWNTTLIPFENQASGQITIIGTSINITERKLAEKKLRESKATKQAMLQALPDMLFRHREDGTFLEFVSSGELEQLLPANEVLGKRMVDVLPLDLAEKVMNAIAQALATNRVQSFEYPIFIDHKLRYYETRVLAMPNHEVLIIVRDISDRKRAENALDQTQKRFHSALKNSPIVVSEVDRELRYTWIYNNHLSLDSKSILGKTDADIFPRKKPPRFRASNNEF
jgi:PAS domain S-box-containing protein